MNAKKSQNCDNKEIPYDQPISICDTNGEQYDLQYVISNSNEIGIRNQQTNELALPYFSSIALTVSQQRLYFLVCQIDFEKKLISFGAYSLNGQMLLPVKYSCNEVKKQLRLLREW